MAPSRTFTIFVTMISEKDLTNSQNIPYEERIARIEKMLDGKESPRAFELGLLLALKMGQEIREKKPLGSTTGDRSEEHTSELQSRAQISYAVFCLDRKSVV